MRRLSWLDISSCSNAIPSAEAAVRLARLPLHRIPNLIPAACQSYWTFVPRDRPRSVRAEAARLRPANRPASWHLKRGITTVILCSVKTAISIPDSIFEEAERLAKTRGWSRSELYANAVTAYVKSERFSGVREKLDAVYGPDEEDSAIDPLLADAQARSLPKENW